MLLFLALCNNDTILLTILLFLLLLLGRKYLSGVGVCSNGIFIYLAVIAKLGPQRVLLETLIIDDYGIT